MEDPRPASLDPLVALRVLLSDEDSDDDANLINFSLLSSELSVLLLERRKAPHQQSR